MLGAVEAQLRDTEGLIPYAIDPEGAERLCSLSEQLLSQEGNPSA